MSILSLSESKPWFLLGLFLICMCTLMMQIIETRILSVISWYHFAFFAIIMAIFGMTGGSLFVYFKVQWFPPRSAARKYGLDLQRLCDCC
jgi:hypothetical protein